MSCTKFKFALAGCGYAGARYIKLLSQHTKYELTALVDTNCARLSEYKALNIPSFHSIEEYFSSGIDADAVIVATPNASHAAIAIASLKENRHVLIEKPMALKSSDAEAILHTATEQNKRVMVVLQNRFSPVSGWLKKVVTSNILGRIFFVQVNCFWNRDERYYRKGSWHGTRELDGGTLFTQFSHFVDLIYWLFGGFGDVHSRFANVNHSHLTELEDMGSAHFEFENGGMGCFNFSTAVWDKSFESSLTIIAENGSVKVSGQYMDKVEYCHIKDHRLSISNDSTSADSNHFKMMSAFTDAIEDSGPTNAEEALNSIRLIESIYKGTSSSSQGN